MEEKILQEVNRGYQGRPIEIRTYRVPNNGLIPALLDNQSSAPIDVMIQTINGIEIVVIAYVRGENIIVVPQIMLTEQQIIDYGGQRIDSNSTQSNF